jgi:hypothetical protein
VPPAGSAGGLRSGWGLGRKLARPSRFDLSISDRLRWIWTASPFVNAAAADRATRGIPVVMFAGRGTVWLNGTIIAARCCRIRLVTGDGGDTGPGRGWAPPGPVVRWSPPQRCRYGTLKIG